MVWVDGEQDGGTLDPAVGPAGERVGERVASGEVDVVEALAQALREVIGQQRRCLRPIGPRDPADLEAAVRLAERSLSSMKRSGLSRPQIRVAAASPSVTEPIVQSRAQFTTCVFARFRR